MSRKLLRIELSPQGCAKAVDELSRRSVEERHKMEQLMSKLAEIGTAEAQRRFARGSTDGNGGVTVVPVPVENGFRVVANGHDVGFIEFGAGFAAGAYHPYVGKAPFPVYPGSFSEQNTGEFAKFGSWHYQGQKYQSLEAEMPLFFAMEKMRQELPRIAKEVFG